MTNQDDKIQGSTGGPYRGPSDEVLRETVRNDNGDLTIQSPAGKIRLARGSDGWMRYNHYLEERSIDAHAEEA